MIQRPEEQYYPFLPRSMRLLSLLSLFPELCILGEYDLQDKENCCFQEDGVCIPTFPFEKARGDI